VIDHASAAAVVTAALRCHEMLTARIAAEPDSPVAEDLFILANRAAGIADEYTELIAANERRQPC
jgi:hypothetical protein